MPQTGARAAQVAIAPQFGWRARTVGELTVTAKGYGRGADPIWLARRASTWGAPPDVGMIEATLGEFDGHFAFVIEGAGWVVAAVDWVRSIPLAWGRAGPAWWISDRALQLRDRLELGTCDIDADAALALAMAGYTIDVATLYRGLEQLGPGEFAVFAGAKPPRRHRYYTYRPWRDDKPDYIPARARSQLAEVTLAIVDDMMKGIGDRELVVPLSAGRDSRLIVSAAWHLGYRNVRCFAYGRAGNFEAAASRAIAERFGYPWRFVPATIPGHRRFFASKAYHDYLNFADSCASVPFVQDMVPLQTLKNDGFVPTGAVIANGNSGDYISGLHIVHSLRLSPAMSSAEVRWRRVLDALYDKHFALWETLRTSGNRDRIGAMLRASLARAGAALGTPSDDYGLFEYAEFQDRQCKYVITGQRIYEFLGHDWRLPLWAKPYLDFWDRVPLAAKANQDLYAEMLETANWGGVWRDVPVNRKTVKPNWLRPIRLLCKAVHSPIGRDQWHRFERRYLQYWMDATCNCACVPYRIAASDQRGARNTASWLTEQYLARHGLSWSGNPNVE